MGEAAPRIASEDYGQRGPTAGRPWQQGRSEVPGNVKPPVSLAIVLVAASAAVGRPALGGKDPWSAGRPAGRPHPAVVQVIVPDRTGFSCGSGALVGVKDDLGLVVTNWHVVRDAAGQIVVVFPDGFRLGATVLGTDRDWDLAALAIRRPQVAPIRLATRPPQPGEPLTIAGYGSGSYREITGRCTQYVAPGVNQPFEMVELSAGARQGDSGGPILNRQGELAGVLFGAAWGQTTGSYCGRVRWFLGSVAGDFRGWQPSATMIARRPQPSRGVPAQGPGPSRPRVPRQSRPRATPDVRRPGPAPSRIARGLEASPAGSDGKAASTPLPIVSIPAGPSSALEWSASQSPAGSPETAEAPSRPRSEPGDAVSRPQATEPLRWEDIAGTTRSEQIKTILAGVGILAIFLHGLRLLSKAYDS